MIITFESTHLILRWPSNTKIFFVDEIDHNQICVTPVNFNIYNKKGILMSDQWRTPSIISIYAQRYVNMEVSL